MTPNEFADTVIHLSVEKQNKFFETLKDQLSEEDWLTVVKFISLHGMFHSEARYKALKKAVKATLTEEIFGHPYEELENKGFDPCNPVYMATINSMPYIYR